MDKLQQKWLQIFLNNCSHYFFSIFSRFIEEFHQNFLETVYYFPIIFTKVPEMSSKYFVYFVKIFSE